MANGTDTVFYPAPGGKWEGLDQGVDFTGPAGTPIYAPASGRITKINLPSASNIGFLSSEYLHLDAPALIDGHSYSDIYLLEAQPTSSVGAHVEAGEQIASFTDQPITGGRGAGLSNQLEIGFAMTPVGPPYGSPNPPWPPQGQEFWNWIRGAAKVGGTPAETPPAGGVSPPAKHTCPNYCFGQSWWPLPGCAGCSGAGLTPAPANPGDIPAAFLCGIPCFGLEKTICSGACWLRVLEIIGGGVLLLLGIFLLGRQLGQATGFTATVRTVRDVAG